MGYQYRYDGDGDDGTPLDVLLRTASYSGLALRGPSYVKRDAYYELLIGILETGGIDQRQIDVIGDQLDSISFSTSITGKSIRTFIEKWARKYAKSESFRLFEKQRQYLVLVDDDGNVSDVLRDRVRHVLYDIAHGDFLEQFYTFLYGHGLNQINSNVLDASISAHAYSIYSYDSRDARCTASAMRELNTSINIACMIIYALINVYREYVPLYVKQDENDVQPSPSAVVTTRRRWCALL